MSVFSENLEAFTDFQKQGMEPVRQFTGIAVETSETLARKNYAFAGDVLEFAVSQARLPVDVSEPKELVERQMAAGKAFAELVSQRMSDYVELGKELQDNLAQFVDVDAEKPAPKAKRARKAKAA